MAPLLALALAAAPAASSVYTALDLDRCRVIERIEEGESVRLECPGPCRHPPVRRPGDGRFDIDAGVENEAWESLDPFNHPGPRVEWRARGRVAIAIVYRLIVDHPRPNARSVLMVESIGRGGRPGCLVAMVDGRTANANGVAGPMPTAPTASAAGAMRWPGSGCPEVIERRSGGSAAAAGQEGSQRWPAASCARRGAG